MSVSTVAANTSGASPGTPIGSLPFTIASRTQGRYATVVGPISNRGVAGAFPVISLPAAGYLRKVSLLITATWTTSASGAIVAGDGPWNLIDQITIADSTGQAIYQPVSGYNLFLINKYLSGKTFDSDKATEWNNPQAGPEYAFSATATTGTAVFRLDLDFEQDANGYGCIPNLDANAALQLQIRFAADTVAFTGGTPTASTISVRATQWYYAPVPSTMGGVPVQTAPPGVGDYLEYRYETKPVTAASENLTDLTARGGLIKGFVMVSRAAGVRTAYPAANIFGIRLDNQDILSAVPVAEWYNECRQMFGYLGADLTTSYAPLAVGIRTGLDAGVIPVSFQHLSRGRDGWLPTRTGSLLQVIHTPGAAATQLEVLTGLMQVRDLTTFYARG